MKAISTQNTGRFIGVIILLHMLAGLSIPYILLKPLTTVPAGFLSTAVDLSFEVKLSVAMLFIGGSLPIVITLMALRFFRDRYSTLLIWLLVIGTVNLALQAVENGHWLSMLFMSQEFNQSPGADIHLFEMSGMLLRSEWKWIHYMHLLFSVTWMFLFYLALKRLSLIPQVLSIFGLAATFLQIIGITLPALFSYNFLLSADVSSIPLGIAYLFTAVWLMIKGFKEYPACNFEKG